MAEEKAKRQRRSETTTYAVLVRDTPESWRPVGNVRVKSGAKYETVIAAAIAELPLELTPGEAEQVWLIPESVKPSTVTLKQADPVLEVTR